MRRGFGERLIVNQIDGGAGASRDCERPAGPLARDIPGHGPIAHSGLNPVMRSAGRNDPIALTPAGRRQTGIFKSPILNQFTVQPAIARMADLFEEYAV